MSILRVRDLRVAIGATEIVKGVDFEVDRGQTLGIVGESGSGKSMTVLAATGLIDAPARRVTGSSLLQIASRDAPVELVGATDRTLRSVHGDAMGFVFQDPSTSLNPYLTVGRQIAESLEVHRGLTRRAAHNRAIALLDEAITSTSSRRRVPPCTIMPVASPTDRKIEISTSRSVSPRTSCS